MDKKSKRRKTMEWILLVAAGVLVAALLFHHFAGRGKTAQTEEIITNTTAIEETRPTEEATTETTTEAATLSQEEQIAVIKSYMKVTPAGTLVTDYNADYEAYYFIGAEIDDAVFARINGKSYTENPYITLDDLRYLKVLHYNFDHQIQVGELIVNADLAEDYLTIFQELFDEEYEIEKMHLIDDYWAGNGDDTDTASCEDNNTSCFCYRAQTNATKLSNHALGRAVDINPQQNPYVTYVSGEAVWYHENSNDYIDRSVYKDHMILADDICCQIFAAHGFEWGGSWKTIKDYQHFEKEE